MISKQVVSYTSYKFANLCRKKLHLLTLEVDYELACLSLALAQNDEEEITNCKERLTKIHTKMTKLREVLNEWG